MRGSVLLTICAHCYNVNTYCLGLRVEFIMYVFYDYGDGRVYNGCMFKHFLNRCFTEVRSEMYWLQPAEFQSLEAAGVPGASAGEPFQLALKLL